MRRAAGALWALAAVSSFFVLCLFVVVNGLRCTTSADVACSFLCLAVALFVFCFGCVVVLVRVTSSAFFCIG